MIKRSKALYAGIALLLSSCGQDYTATPANSTNNTVFGNPLAPAVRDLAAGQVRFKVNGVEKNFYNVFYIEGFDTAAKERIISGYTPEPNPANVEAFTVRYTGFMANGLNTYTSQQGTPMVQIAFGKGFDANNEPLSNYTTVVGRQPLNQSQILYLDKTSMKGTFSGTLFQLKGFTFDMNDSVTVTDGTFFVTLL